MRPGRRQVLAGLPVALLAPRALAAEPLFTGDTVPAMARALAATPFIPAPEVLPPALAALSYDAYRGVRFRPEQAIWRDAGLPFQLQMFHRGGYFHRAVQIFEVVNGHVAPISYSRDLFRFDSGDPGPLPADLGFAGFRIHTPINAPDRFDELAVFLGASYFRGVARNGVYGLSARGLSIGSGGPHEEFPDFRAYWIERPAPDATRIVIHALMDSPSLAGAYRFEIAAGDTTWFDVTAQLFARTAVADVGVAPLTSMYLFGPEQPRRFDDFRPEVHDTDGLLMAASGGGRIWRSLANPPAKVSASSFPANRPVGFGLLQRQRDFAAYEDMEARYDRRPGAWVQPQDGFGAGETRLIELPATEERQDNIVASWRPADFVPGQAQTFVYRLGWGADPAPAANLAPASGWRTGAGGGAGRRRFVVIFTGAPEQLAGVDPTVTATTGQIRNVVVEPGEAPGVLRLSFELDPAARMASDLSAGLTRAGAPVSETWMYRWLA